LRSWLTVTLTLRRLPCRLIAALSLALRLTALSRLTVIATLL